MANVLSKITSSITVVLLAALGIFYLVAGDAIRQAAPYMVWGTVVFFAIAASIRLWFLAQAHYLQNRAIKAETADKVTQHKLNSERAAWELERDRILAEIAASQMVKGLVYGHTLGSTPEIRPFPVGISKQAERMLPDETGLVSDLLGVLLDLQNILVVGGKGSGKTTLLQWIEAERIRQGKVIVLDSHAQPAQWSGHTIGMGRDYTNIKKAMVSLVDKLNRRYQRYAKGENQFTPIHTLIDEFTLLPKVMKGIGYDIQGYSVPMLTEGRKVAINCIWGIHSDRAKALGLEGMADLKECFDAIVKLVKVEGQPAYALVDLGEGQLDTKFRLPGKFVIPQRQQLESGETQVDTAIDTQVQPGKSIFDLPVASEMKPNDTEQAVIDTWRETHNKSACYRVWHKLTLKSEFSGSINGDKLKVVDQILATWGEIN